jgi:hypothetical protein
MTAPETKCQEFFSRSLKKSADFMRVCGFGVPLLKYTLQLGGGGQNDTNHFSLSYRRRI